MTLKVMTVIGYVVTIPMNQWLGLDYQMLQMIYAGSSYGSLNCQLAIRTLADDIFILLEYHWIRFLY